MDEPRVGSVVRVEIEKLVTGGAGLGRIDGRVVLVVGGIPGEKIDVRLQEKRGSVLHGTIEETIQRSLQRVEPVCPVYGRCGGCDWQHISYDEQIRWKRRITAENLQRIGGIEYPLEEIDVVESAPFGYRNRVRVISGDEGYGFRQLRSHNVVSVDRCPVATSGINEFLGVPHSRDGATGELTLFDAGDQTFRDDRDRVATIRLFGRPFRFDPRGFSQSNLGLLPALAGRLAEATSQKRIVDLYAGAGLLPFLRFAAEDQKHTAGIVCVERDRRNARYVRENLATVAPTSTIEIHEKSVESAIRRLHLSGTGGSILLDPPRGGLSPTVRRWIADHARWATSVIYLSCDSAALARDLGSLSDEYVLQDLTVFDFFPQTAHIETLAVLRPRRG